MNTENAGEKDKTIKLEKPTKANRVSERKVTVANTDLLFKLFETVEKDVKPKSQSGNVTGSTASSQSTAPQIRRGRYVQVILLMWNLHIFLQTCNFRLSNTWKSIGKVHNFQSNIYKFVLCSGHSFMILQTYTLD